uniref:Uncharacterized protein n=1 Tax=Arundo donax TaxID=35708 RepID=A0A0A9DLJ5_ARUDO
MDDGLRVVGLLWELWWCFCDIVP